MKALSIKQPWSWLIAHGHKPVENRTWSTNFRGEFLIHAGKTFDHEGYGHVRIAFPDLEIPALGSYELGGIVGRARLVDCVDDHPSPWFCGPWGFVIEAAEPLLFRPLRGHLNFFNVPAAPTIPPAATVVRKRV